MKNKTENHLVRFESFWIDFINYIRNNSYHPLLMGKLIYTWFIIYLNLKLLLNIFDPIKL